MTSSYSRLVLKRPSQRACLHSSLSYPGGRRPQGTEDSACAGGRTEELAGVAPEGSACAGGRTEELVDVAPEGSACAGGRTEELVGVAPGGSACAGGHTEELVAVAPAGVETAGVEAPASLCSNCPGGPGTASHRTQSQIEEVDPVDATRVVDTM